MTCTVPCLTITLHASLPDGLVNEGCILEKDFSSLGRVLFFRAGHFRLCCAVLLFKTVVLVSCQHWREANAALSSMMEPLKEGTVPSWSREASTPPCSVLTLRLNPSAMNGNYPTPSVYPSFHHARPPSFPSSKRPVTLYR